MDVAVTAASQYMIDHLLVPSTAAVHSIYRNTVNVITSEGQLLAIQANGSPLSPISLLTPFSQKELALLPILEGTPCRIAPDAVILNPVHAADIRLNYARHITQIFDSALVPPDLPAPAFYIIQARQFLSSAPPGSFGRLAAETTQKDLLLSAAQAHLERAAVYYAKKEWNPAAEELCALVGLGIGLTPSGDDFLCGLLAGLLWKNEAGCPMLHALSTRLRHALPRTNPISAAFLNCALDGQFSEAVIRFFALSPMSSASETAACQEGFRAIGHTSGFDALSGILYALILPGG